MGEFFVSKVAVLGAGLMGAQIAAHLANAEIPVILFGQAATQGEMNGKVISAIVRLNMLEPNAFAVPDRVAYIDVANYDQHLAMLGDCDLIIEAISENLESKEHLLRKIAPYIGAHAIVASNTSGLSINTLSEALPEVLRNRFLGIHFFNPLRYMPLVELVGSRNTAPELIDQVETWLVSRLGKSVVRALDTPNFVANRVGIFSILAVMHHTRQFGLGFDVADALTGPIIGRPRSATYRTADVIGLDTLVSIINTMQDSLPGDPWCEFYASPEWLLNLVEQGATGHKAHAGIFRKEGQSIKVLELESNSYRDAEGGIALDVMEILKNRDPAGKFEKLRASKHPQAQFLWAIFRDVFHYAAFHLGAIANNARDVDLAMRWGYGWVQGPFETWQSAGWRDIADAVAADIVAGKSMCSMPLPDWVFECHGVHFAEGSYSAKRNEIEPRSTLPVYQRQIFPERVLGEKERMGATFWENESVRLWSLPQVDRGIVILSVKTKNHILGQETVIGVQEAVARAETEFDAMVFWHEAPFSFGANLKEMLEAAQADQFDLLETYITEFQKASMALKYARFPVVAAVQGMALGGGCELMMHTAKRVIAQESFIGLVETGVGLIPAGGGCKEFALRAGQAATKTESGDPIQFILPVLKMIVGATVSKSAAHAKALGFVLDSDTIVYNSRELLFVALREARALAETGSFPRVSPRNIKLAGQEGLLKCEKMLAGMKDRGALSEHDLRVAQCVATALCGGGLESGSRLDENGLLAIERKLFVELTKCPKTQQRIQYLLEHGKPLVN